MSKISEIDLRRKLPDGPRKIKTTFHFKAPSLPPERGTGSFPSAPAEPVKIADDEPDPKEIPEMKKPTRRFPKKASVDEAHNLLGESLDDLTLEDESTTFDHVLWQAEMKGQINLLELFAGSARTSQA